MLFGAAGALATVWATTAYFAPPPSSAKPARSQPVRDLPPAQADAAARTVESSKEALWNHLERSGYTEDAPEDSPTNTLELEDASEPDPSRDFEDAANAFEDETRDSAWALEKENAITRELRALSQAFDFEFVEAECKTETCAVTIRWSGNAGSSVYERLTTTPFGRGCLVRILPPRERSQEARLYLQCKEARERASAAVPIVAQRANQQPSFPGPSKSAEDKFGP